MAGNAIARVKIMYSGRTQVLPAIGNNVATIGCHIPARG
jgi:hypothetical protein